MKKFLAVTIAGLLTLGGAAAFSACTVEQSENGKVYLVPGTYISEGERVENTVKSGAKKLTDDECGQLNIDNTYICTVSYGSALPSPASTRKDSDGNAFEFNGWWTIVNATVTYYKNVPSVAKTDSVILYADWRAPLSQPKDPIIPEGGEKVEPNHYMIIKRADETEEKITLRKSWAQEGGALTLGYKYPVELTTQAFTLSKGDKIYIYTTGLTDGDEAVIAPEHNNGCTIELTASTEKENDTKDYLEAYAPTSFRNDPYLTCIAEETALYNIYIKFFNKGTEMQVYLEPKE